MIVDENNKCHIRSETFFGCAPEGRMGMTTAIETEQLCKSYGKHMCVKNVDLRVPEGSIYGFLGPNGAGKSTTMKMILGLVNADQGQISVFGEEMNRKNRLDVLEKTGSLIESPSYYGHLTGRENLEIVRVLRGRTRGRWTRR